MALVLHVNCHEFIADLWSMLSIVAQTELLSLHLLLHLLVLFNLDAFGFNLLLPSDLIKALSEENYVHKHCFIEAFVHLLRDSEKVKSKDLIDKHLLAFWIAQVIVVALPRF